MAITKARRKSASDPDGSPIIVTEPLAVELAPALNTTDSNRQVFKAVDPGGFNVSYDINYLADSSKKAYSNDSSNLPPHLLHPAQITTASDSSGLTATYRFLTRSTDSDGSGNSTIQTFYHKYIASDGLRNISTTKSFKFNFVAEEAEVLIVGGGGGGGSWAGGGGGAGAARYYSAFSITAGQAYTVTIGAGGQGASSGSNDNMADGVNSVWADFTAGGGGKGGGYATGGTAYGTGSNGASHGGNYGTATGHGSDPGAYGSEGGGGSSGSLYSGGGGGGATGAGVDATGSASGTGGNGGAGLTSSITGVSVVYAEGGGGGMVQESSAYPTLGGGTAGAGGRGGGSGAGEAGLANTGSGGGGAGSTNTSGSSNQGGGAGGSGVCIIAYPSRFAAPTISNGLTYTSLTSRSGYRVYKFTAGTGTVTW